MDNAALIKDFDIDFSKLPTGGVYVDNAYMLCKLVSAPFVTSVFEAGAGLSTVIFATMCERLGKKLITFEDKPKWAKTTDGYLSDRKLAHRVTSTDSRLENVPALTEPFELAWVDGNIFWNPKRMAEFGPEDANYYGKFCHRPGGVRFYKDVLMDAVIIFDDGEDANCLIEIKRAMTAMGRNPDDMFLSNPKKRKDRHQLVSLPFSGHPAEQLIKEMGHWYPVTQVPPRK